MTLLLGSDYTTPIMLLQIPYQRHLNNNIIYFILYLEYIIIFTSFFIYLLPPRRLRIMGHSQSTPSVYNPTSIPQQPSLSNSRHNFTYKPLTHPRNFRILRLKRNLRHYSRVWQDLPLHGSIVEASLDNVPEYFALSYTWGNPSLSDKIVINGKVLGITQSCADALRRMLKGKPERMIWVDSICINQAGMCLHRVLISFFAYLLKMIHRRYKKGADRFH
jgi:hypothetical protein